MNVRRWTRGRCRKAVAEDDEEVEEDVARDARDTRRVSREGRPMRAPLRSASARGRDMAESCWIGFREEGGEGRKQGREGHHYAGVTWVLRSCYSPPAPAWQLAPSRGDLSSSKPTTYLLSLLRSGPAMSSPAAASDDEKYTANDNAADDNDDNSSPERPTKTAVSSSLSSPSPSPTSRFFFPRAYVCWTCYCLQPRSGGCRQSGTFRRRGGES